MSNTDDSFDDWDETADPGAEDTFGALLLEVAAADPLPPEALHTYAPGDVLDDRYELLAELGRGGFGIVWRARQRSTGQDVAIKLLRPGAISRNPAVIERFEQEKNTLTRLKHPHVVPLIDWGKLPSGELFMALAFIDGATLGDHLEAHGPLPQDEALRLMAQVADALCAAHEAGVVHRDLKPGNIMLTSSGALTHATVLDFGIAALLESDPVEGERPEITQGEHAPGTPHYMAPEQLQGERSPQIDIYAWGLVLLECITGDYAVPERSPLKAYAWQLSNTPLPLPEALQGSPLGELLLEATHKDPAQRFATASQLLDAIHALDHRPMPALPPALAPRPRAVVLGLALIVAVSLIVVLWPRAASQHATPPSPPVSETPPIPDWLPRARAGVLLGALAVPPETQTSPIPTLELDAVPVTLGLSPAELERWQAHYRDINVALLFDLQFETSVLPRQQWSRPQLSVTGEITRSQWSEHVPALPTGGDCGPPPEQTPGPAPRTRVTAREAEAWCTAIGMRLPTAREWEAIARGPEETRASQPELLRDLSGSVWEWVRCEASDALRNCRSAHGIRGGSQSSFKKHGDFWHQPFVAGSLPGLHDDPCFRAEELGFRCVK